MSCVQREEHQKDVQELFKALENGSGEVNFTGFMFQVAAFAIIFKTTIDDMSQSAE